MWQKKSNGGFGEIFIVNETTVAFFEEIHLCSSNCEVTTEYSGIVKDKDFNSYFVCDSSICLVKLKIMLMLNDFGWIDYII